MAVTAQAGTTATVQAAGQALDSLLAGKKAEIYAFEAVQSGAGDQNSTLDLVYLPAGRHRVLLAASAISTPAITNGQCDLGHTGYTEPDGTAVAAAPTAFQANKAITSAAIWAPGAAIWLDYNSAVPVLVRMTFDGSGGVGDGQADVALGTCADSATISDQLGSRGLVVLWDPAKVPGTYAVVQALRLLVKVLRQRAEPTG